MNTYIYWLMWKKEMKEVELRIVNDDGEYWSMRKEKLLMAVYSTGIESINVSNTFKNKLLLHIDYQFDWHKQMLAIYSLFDLNVDKEF